MCWAAATCPMFQTNTLPLFYYLMVCKHFCEQGGVIRSRYCSASLPEWDIRVSVWGGKLVEH